MVEVAIEKNNRVLVAQVRGRISDADVWEFVERIQELSDAASCDVLYDCSHVTDSDLTPESVRKLAQLQRHDPDKKIAIVAGADVVFGMCRMFQILSSDSLPGLAVFRDMAPAREYIGLGPRET